MAKSKFEPRWIDDDRAFSDLVDHLLEEPVFTFDTEFHRERSYFPKLALIQLGWKGGIAVVDPLACDPAPLARLLEGSGLAIVHAADQDLEVLQHACRSRPRRLFDTQIAAAFCGMGLASLAKLVGSIVGARIPKGDRLTDWTRRPLEASQIEYAASDVAYLLEIADELKRRAEKAGTLEWIEEECERLRSKPVGPIDPETAWWRIKGSRGFRGDVRGVAQEVAAWREREAARRDLPPRFVLSDLALSSIVQRGPRSLEDLGRIRGLDGRALKNGWDREILAAVERGRALPEDGLRRPAPSDPPLEDLGATVALGQAFIALLSRERGIEASLLASRTDIHAFAAGRESSRLASGWRHEIAGRALRELLDGRRALTGDGRGGVDLVETAGDRRS
jgi:ribonuclease D